MRIVGFVVLCLVGAIYLVSGLIVPIPWRVGLWIVWLVAVGAAIARRDRRWYPLALGVVTAVVWVAVVSFGDLVLDWSA